MEETVDETIENPMPETVYNNVVEVEYVEDKPKEEPIFKTELNVSNEQMFPSAQQEDEGAETIAADDEQTKDDQNVVAEGEELSAGTLEELEQKKKLQRREEKRRKDAALRKHEPQPKPEPGPQPQPKPQPELERNSGTSIQRSSIDSETTPKYKQSMSLYGEEHEEQDGLISADASSSEDEFSRPSCSTSFKHDFLQNIYFPSFSDISSVTSEKSIESIRPSVEPEMVEVKDEGNFVDTGHRDSGSSVSHKDVQDVQEEQMPEEESEAESSSSSAISFDWPFDLEDEVVPLPQTNVDDEAETALNLLFDMHSSTNLARAESTTAMERQRAHRETHQIAMEFLCKLIDDAVEAVEYVDPQVVLSAKMDKHKMITDLHGLLKEYMWVKQYNTDAGNKMYDYYRRLGQMRVIDVLPPQVEEVEFRRHREALHRLDHLKAKVVETKRINNLLLASVHMDMVHESNIAISTLESLEKCVRATLIRKDMQFLPRIVDLELRRMENVRNEISDSRLWLITRQHTLGRLIERKRQFDEITETLTMDQFLAVQREVSALDTKVEERSYDLYRMHDRCTRQVHQLAFVREKIGMLSENLKDRRTELGEKMQRQHKLRDEALKLKLKRAHLKEQKSELQEKSGLLYKPALLYDFDKTVETLEIKTERVKELWHTVNDLEARIAMYENLARSSLPLSHAH